MKRGFGKDPPSRRNIDKGFEKETSVTRKKNGNYEKYDEQTVKENTKLENPRTRCGSGMLIERIYSKARSRSSGTKFDTQ